MHPFVGVAKTASELQALVQPFFDDLAALGITYTATPIQSFPTFYDLYNALFETEVAGNSALTGGWTIGRMDVASNHAAIIDAFKTVTAAGSFMIGHMWSAGHGLPPKEWGNSAVNPRFRSVVDKLITIVPVGGNAPLKDKEAAQHKLTYVVDAALRAAAPNGAAYINEVNLFSLSTYYPFSMFRIGKLLTGNTGRPLPAQLAGRLLGHQLPQAAQDPAKVRSRGRVLLGLDAGNGEVEPD